MKKITFVRESSSPTSKRPCDSIQVLEAVLCTSAFSCQDILSTYNKDDIKVVLLLMQCIWGRLNLIFVEVSILTYYW